MWKAHQATKFFIKKQRFYIRLKHENNDFYYDFCRVHRRYTEEFKGFLISIVNFY
jgi:hypothetical protein